MPEQDTVVAINSGVKDMQALINIVWDNLLPACSPHPSPPTPPPKAELKAKLAGLRSPTVAGWRRPRRRSRSLGKRFAFASNPLKLDSVTPRGNTQIAST